MTGILRLFLYGIAHRTCGTKSAHRKWDRLVTATAVQRTSQHFVVLLEQLVRNSIFSQRVGTNPHLNVRLWRDPYY